MLNCNFVPLCDHNLSLRPLPVSLFLATMLLLLLRLLCANPNRTKLIITKKFFKLRYSSAF